METIAMTSVRELKKQAWENLKGKRKTMGLVWLFYFGITLACVLLCLIYIGTILQFFLIPPFLIGMKMCFLKFVRNCPVKPGDVLDGIGHTGRAVSLYFVNSLLAGLWSLLLVVPGIVKNYAYSMSFYVLADHPDMTQSDAREESERLMDGNKFRLFLLDISFLGWILLSLLTGGILLFWVQPYMQTAYVLFYKELKTKKSRYGILRTDVSADKADSLSN